VWLVAGSPVEGLRRAEAHAESRTRLIEEGNTLRAAEVLGSPVLAETECCRRAQMEATTWRASKGGTVSLGWGSGEPQDAGRPLGTQEVSGARPGSGGCDAPHGTEPIPQACRAPVIGANRSRTGLKTASAKQPHRGDAIQCIASPRQF